MTRWLPGADVDLSGSWRGLYSYPSGRPPVAFTAELTESGSWLTGTTIEVATRREVSGRTLTATLQGRRSGNSVKFLKLYDASVSGYDAVAYEGRVNGEGTEIEGRWSVPSNWSGTFLMIREGAAATVRARRVAERV